MQAQFFGPAERPLFGMRHAAVGAARDTAVLICPSWGLEALRSQRGLRQLGNALAAAGFEVLRFDYTGTGDSHDGGHEDSRSDGNSLCVEQWLEDIATAARELSESSGRERICLFGHRIGALLAAEAARRGTVRTESLVAFDAPENGQQFVDMLFRVQKELDAHKNRYRNQKIATAADDELLGFDWPLALHKDIAALPAVSHRRLLWASTQGHDVKAPSDAELFDAGESARWGQLSALFAPWTPTPMLKNLAERMRTWLP